MGTIDLFRAITVSITYLLDIADVLSTISFVKALNLFFVKSLISTKLIEPGFKVSTTLACALMDLALGAKVVILLISDEAPVLKSPRASAVSLSRHEILIKTDILHPLIQMGSERNGPQEAHTDQSMRNSSYLIFSDLFSYPPK